MAAVKVYPGGQVQVQTTIRNTGETWKYAVGHSIKKGTDPWIDFPWGYKSYSAGQEAVYYNTITIPAGTPKGIYLVRVGVYEKLAEGLGVNQLDFYDLPDAIEVL